MNEHFFFWERRPPEAAVFSHAFYVVERVAALAAVVDSRQHYREREREREKERKRVSE